MGRRGLIQHVRIVFVFVSTIMLIVLSSPSELHQPSRSTTQLLKDIKEDSALFHITLGCPLNKEAG